MTTDYSDIDHAHDQALKQGYDPEQVPPLSGETALAEVTADFVERMERAASSLDALADQMHDAPREYGRRMERARLRGKAEGMRLAISYWRDAERFAGADISRTLDPTSQRD